MPKRKEVKLTVGMFAGILNDAGELLVRRRKEKGSVISGKNFYGDYELPGGGLTEKELKRLLTAAALDRLSVLVTALNERSLLFLPQLYIPSNKLYIPSVIDVLVGALEREVMEEEGLKIIPEYVNDILRNDLYRAILVQKEIGKVDIAVCVPVMPNQWSGEPTGEIEWVSPARIKELSEQSKGEQIVSGWGKRMCQMMLWALTFSPRYKEQAGRYLSEIHTEKGFPEGTLETISII